MVRCIPRIGRLSDGVIVDERVFHDDFINLSHNTGVFLYDDLLVILSVRYQCIYILQVREAGLFVDVRSIGTHCREDDELKINTQAQVKFLDGISPCVRHTSVVFTR